MRFGVKVTFYKEFDVDPEKYPSSDVDDMLKTDLENISDNLWVITEAEDVETDLQISVVEE